MTALFCEYGEMKLGQRILEVGGGCGYMSCVYAEVVAPLDQPKSAWGHVWSAEIIEQLAAFGRMNVERLGYSERALSSLQTRLKALMMKRKHSI